MNSNFLIKVSIRFTFIPLYIGLNCVRFVTYISFTSNILRNIILRIVWYSLGAVHMSRASPANRADLSHENLYFSTT